MTLKLNFDIQKIFRTVRLDALRGLEPNSIAYWYCGIYKNQRNGWQPNVLVGFRNVQSGNISEVMDMRRVPLDALGQVALGTIWTDGVCESIINYDISDFEIDFRDCKWSFVSAYDSIINNIEQPFPQGIHRLAFDMDKNWLIAFEIRSGGRLLIPCLEFFSRCYGRSQKLKRILSTFPWMGSAEAHKSQLYAPLDEPEEPNKWKVKLRQGLVNGDTVILAHAKYDPYTERAAKSIYGQIEGTYNPESKSPLFIQVPPWFQGPAEIRVRGVWFDNKRSFLALRIIGSSDPDGIVITRDRDNSNKKDGVNPEAYGEAWAGAIRKGLVRPPDIVDLTGDLEPDCEAKNVEIFDDDFLVLGVPRRIVDRHGKKVTRTSGIQRNGNSVSIYSSGSQHGSGKGVGQASIQAKPVMESHGILIDMWNAVRHTQVSNNKIINNVEWFTFDVGYKSTALPSLIALDPREEFKGQNIPIETRHWPFIDVASSTPRGVLVIRLTVSRKHVHIIEIQRRPRIKTDSKGKKFTSEESFQCLVISFVDERSSVQQLKRLMTDICFVRGIVKKLTHTIEFSHSFNHTPTKHKGIPCEAVVRMALKKVGVVIPESDSQA